MTRTSDFDDKQFPWWVRAIAFVGAPTVAAGYLMFVLVSNVDTRITTVQETLRLHQIDTSYAMKANEQQTLQLQAMFRLLQQICINTAKTAEERNNCWNPWR